MNLPQLISRKKLRAITARRALGGTEMDYEEMSEPNMKLSRALLIVLVLHVVAVAGIIAFNTIKARQDPLPSVSNENVTAKVAPANTAKADDSTAVASTRTEETKVSKAALPVVKDDRKNDRPKPAEASSTKPAGTKTYVVAKGDSPVSIARKFKVSYDNLMAANGIEDPHKLKIGQKLVIPKSAKPKKPNE